MAKLKSEIEVACPCCQTMLVIDLNLGRVVAHKEPERADKPELSEAQRIVAEQAARREAMFQQSVESEKTRGDALSKRFEEALRQARAEPITKATAAPRISNGVATVRRVEVRMGTDLLVSLWGFAIAR